VAEIPKCANSVNGGGCWKSDVVLLNESDEAWVFQCRTCELIQAVSKDNIRDKSKFEDAAKRKREQEEISRRWEKRRKIFV
jgi:hypothetical protein